VPDGGPQGLGYIRATRRVIPGEWFFKAHFHQDPVVPGSLGLESFLHLVRFVALERWGNPPGSRLESVASNERHEWVYRGQVVPVDGEVTVDAVITQADDSEGILRAEGFLSVDGRIIYGMRDFTLRQVRGSP
jgi:3-hydroxymyristoyl/3-hydroxydecanoyl-(acyl carrier protein) dehydratase